MASQSVFLNNVPVSNIHFIESSENIIICNDIKEEFLGISTLVLEDRNILCEHIENSVVKCNVRIGDSVYENVPFNLVVDRKGVSKIALNKNTLTNPSLFVELKEEESLPINESFIEVEKEDPILEETLTKLKEREKVIAGLEHEIQRIKESNKKQKVIEERKVETFLQNKIERGIEDYKQKLFQDFFTINEEQNKIKTALITEAVDGLRREFDEKYIETVTELQAASRTDVEKYTADFLKNLEKTLKENQDLSLTDLKNLIEETINGDLFVVTDELKNKLNIKIDKDLQSINTKLEEYKQSIKDELVQIFEKDTEKLKDTIKESVSRELIELKDQNLQELDSVEKDLNTVKEKLDNTKNQLSENFNLKLVGLKDELVTSYIKELEENNKSLRNELQVHLEQLQKRIDQKVVEQVKFDGNDLVLQATKNLIEEDAKTGNKLSKFKDQILKDLQAAAETYATQANKRMLRYAEMMSGGGSVAMQFANGGTMNGDLNVVGNILSGGRDLASVFGGEGVSQFLSYNENNQDLTIIGGNTVSLSGLLPASIFQSASGDWSSTNTTVQSNSANWESTYTLVKDLSANWPEQQTLHFNDLTNTLSILSGNQISLSSLDDKEFATAMAIALS